MSTDINSLPRDAEHSIVAAARIMMTLKRKLADPGRMISLQMCLIASAVVWLNEAPVGAETTMS